MRKVLSNLQKRDEVHLFCTASELDKARSSAFYSLKALENC